jgi:hypothetical protein
MFSLRHSRPELDSLNHVTRGHQGRSNRMTGRSILQIVGIVETVEIAEIINNIPQSRKRSGCFIAMMMQRSGARSIAPQERSGRVLDFSGSQEDASTTSGAGAMSRRTSLGRY